jgi:hypothetical protein
MFLVHNGCALRVHIHFLDPSYSLDPKQPDEGFQDRIDEMRKPGLGALECESSVYKNWPRRPAEFEAPYAALSLSSYAVVVSVAREALLPKNTPD